MIWDKLSSFYDMFEKLYNGKVNRGIAGEIKNYVSAGDDVLECACGTGLLSVPIAEKCGRLVATDYSDGMLKQAKKKMKKYKNARVKKMDIMDIPYKTNAFDVVVAANVIHLLDRPDEALRELMRVCKEDGRIVIPTYINKQKKNSLFAAKLLAKTGVSFKRQFDLASYKAFFSQLGIEKVTYKVVEGRMSCAFAVIENVPVEIKPLPNDKPMEIRKTTVKGEGFEGILHPVDGRKDKVLIVVSGSNGGMKMTDEIACFYEENNIPALAVAMFGTKGTQKNLDRVPIETIENAIKWLEKQGYEKIGIDGTSKGSEMALLCGSMFPRLSCVIARVPSYFVSEGLVPSGKSKKPSGTSCWSYQGKELPYAPYNYRHFNLPKIILKEKELHLLTINREKTVTEESIIPVEKINGCILLLSGVNDVVWPSYESSLYIMKRLGEHNFPHTMKHVAFTAIGHGMLTSLSPAYRLAFKSERRQKKQCAKERQQLAKELLSWVNEEWK